MNIFLIFLMKSIVSIELIVRTQMEGLQEFVYIDSVTTVDSAAMSCN